MSASLIVVVTLIYLGVAVSLLVKDGRIGLALCFLGYSIANVGMIIDVMKLDTTLMTYLARFLNVRI